MSKDDCASCGGGKCRWWKHAPSATKNAPQDATWSSPTAGPETPGRVMHYSSDHTVPVSRCPLCPAPDVPETALRERIAYLCDTGATGYREEPDIDPTYWVPVEAVLDLLGDDPVPETPGPGPEFLRVAFLPADRYRVIATDDGWDVLSDRADGSFS